MTEAKSDIGSNSMPAGALRAFIERIEHQETEKQEIADGVKEIYQEAKSSGFNPRIMRKIVALRKQALDARREMASIMSVYLTELGMQGELPL